MFKSLKNNYWLWLLVLIFIATRFFGLGQYYHQDEYRWVSQVYTEEFGEVDSPHPPVMQFLLSLGGKIFGYDNLRLVPFIFGIFSLLLIYFFALKITNNKKIAYIASGLYILNIYSLIASVMLDIDGTLLPFLALLTYYLYLKIKEGDKKSIFLFIIVVSIGFLTKLSFILFAGALVFEYLWTLYDRGILKLNIKKTALQLISMGTLIFGAYMFYGTLDPRFTEYATNFKVFNFNSRAYFDLGLRLFKFFIWLSPLLLLPMVWGLFKKEFFVRYRVWYVYTLFNLLFYLVIFDFARLPIERYFMFIIIPAVLISADVIFSFVRKINKKYLALSACAFIALLTYTILATHAVVPLNPKEAYVEKAKDLDFNFLIPLTGGSGPIGFYGSAQFILWVWLACAAGILMNKKKWAMTIFLVFGIGYNIFLSAENLTGMAYGSVDNITKQSVRYVIENPEIDGVITYYDAGVYYLILADKYDARFYTAPSRNYTERMTSYRGHYMIVDFPAVDKNGIYWKLITKCKEEKKFTDKYVESYIFDCRSLPPAS